MRINLVNFAVINLSLPLLMAEGSKKPYNPAFMSIKNHSISIPLITKTLKLLAKTAQ